MPQANARQRRAAVDQQLLEHEPDNGKTIMMKKPRTSARKYTRLNPSIWAKIRAAWETGEMTLEELGDEHGVSKRTLQTHFRKHASVKGSEAAAMAAAVKSAVFEDILGSSEVRIARGRETRIAAYEGAMRIEGLLNAQIEMAGKDPSSAYKALSATKLLAMAAQTFERTQAIKWKALGLDQDQDTDELPVIRIIDLSNEDIAELARRNGNEEDADLLEEEQAAASQADQQTAYERNEIVEEI
jgi:hypothetical protein